MFARLEIALQDEAVPEPLTDGFIEIDTGGIIIRLPPCAWIVYQDCMSQSFSSLSGAPCGVARVPWVSPGLVR
jgi:hypothetical protein